MASPNLPPLLVVGWGVIAVGGGFIFWQDWAWLFLTLLLCGAAWWAVARSERLLLRLLGGSLLVLFIPGIWLAAQPDILPGLDRRQGTVDQITSDTLAVIKGTSPATLRMRARMKTISAAIYAAHILVALPLAFLLPPLLAARQRRKLGGPIILSKPLAFAGLAAWAPVLVLAGLLAWPSMERWAEPPAYQVQWPPQLPSGDLPDDPDDPGDPEDVGL